MKAKLRRQIGKLLKELKIPAKLYRGSKLKIYRSQSGIYLKNLLLRLELSRPGTIVGDCGVVNHVVKGFARNHFTNELWRSKGYVFVFPQLVYEDGTWSCGCESSPEPPRSRSYIETFLQEMYMEEDPGWPLSNHQIRLRDSLLRNEHVVDDRGVLLESMLPTSHT